ncbi:adhesion G-protein coupled receptor G4-like [Clytia hemisphaerica]|uniref:Uncharacterized protein n=1 Tax=Clytia hemisphaerica TaxID=252671 RepID=A0A7M5USF0_9CNID|eukprot:TCONS_00005166-protein
MHLLFAVFSILLFSGANSLPILNKSLPQNAVTTSPVNNSTTTPIKAPTGKTETKETLVTNDTQETTSSTTQQPTTAEEEITKPALVSLIKPTDNQVAFNTSTPLLQSTEFTQHYENESISATSAIWTNGYTFVYTSIDSNNEETYYVTSTLPSDVFQTTQPNDFPHSTIVSHHQPSTSLTHGNQNIEQTTSWATEQFSTSTTSSSSPKETTQPTTSHFSPKETTHPTTSHFYSLNPTTSVGERTTTTIKQTTSTTSSTTDEQSTTKDIATPISTRPESSNSTTAPTTLSSSETTSTSTPTSTLFNNKTSNKTQQTFEGSTEPSTPSATNTIEPIYHCEEEWIRNERKGDYFFARTTIWDEVKHRCQYGSTKKLFYVKRECNWDKKLERAYWGEVDLTYCLTPTKEKGIIVDIEDMEFTSTNWKKGLTYVSTIMDNQRTIVQSALDFSVIVKTIHSVLGVSTQALHTETVSKVLLVLGNLLQLDNELLQEVDSYKEMLKVFDSIAYNFIHTTSRTTLSVNGKFIALSLRKVRSRQITFATTSALSGNISMLYENQVGAMNSVTLPQSVFDGLPGEETVLFHEMVPTEAMPTLSNETMVSNIISVRVLTEQKKFDQLKDPIKLTFHVGPLKHVNVSCAFWDIQNGLWSKEGCQVTSWLQNEGVVECQCQHLTDFAVIAESAIISSMTKGDEGSGFAHIFAFIGSFIAVLALGATLITYLCVKTIRSQIASKAIASFSLSLMLAFISFVAALTFVKKETLCFIVGRFLHYFILTSFSWMFIQAILLYRTIVVMSTKLTDGFYFKLMSVFAWGLPLVITGVTSFFSYQMSFKQNNEHDVKLCFVEKAQFYGAVLAPTVLLAIVNVLLFIPIVRNMGDSDLLLTNTIEKNKKENTKRAKATFLITAIMVLLWTFAILHGMFQLVALQFIYLALIPVLGVLVCVLNIIRNEDAKKVWLKIFVCCDGDEKESDVPELVKLRPKANLNSTDNEAKRVSIVINGGSYGYGTETFGGESQQPRKNVSKEAVV